MSVEVAPLKSQVKAFFKQAAKVVDKVDSARKSGKTLSTEELASVINLLHSVANNRSFDDSFFLADARNSRELLLELMSKFFFNSRMHSSAVSSAHRRHRAQMGQLMLRSQLLCAPQLPWPIPYLSDFTIACIENEKWLELPSFIGDSIEWLLNLQRDQHSAVGFEDSRRRLSRLSESQRKLLYSEMIDLNQSSIHVSTPAYVLLYLATFALSNRLPSISVSESLKLEDGSGAIDGKRHAFSEGIADGSGGDYHSSMFGAMFVSTMGPLFGGFFANVCDALCDTILHPFASLFAAITFVLKLILRAIIGCVPQSRWLLDAVLPHSVTEELMSATVSEMLANCNALSFLLAGDSSLNARRRKRTRRIEALKERRKKRPSRALWHLLNGVHTEEALRYSQSLALSSLRRKEGGKSKSGGFELREDALFVFEQLFGDLLDCFNPMPLFYIANGSVGVDDYRSSGETESGSELLAVRLVEAVSECWLATGSPSVSISNRCQILPMLESLTRRLALRQYAHFVTYSATRSSAQLRSSGAQQRRGGHPLFGGSSGFSPPQHSGGAHLFGYGKLPSGSCLTEELAALLPQLFWFLKDATNNWPLDFMSHFDLIVELMLNVCAPWRVAFLEGQKYSFAKVKTEKKEKKAWISQMAHALVRTLRVGFGFDSGKASKSKSGVGEYIGGGQRGHYRHSEAKADFVSVCRNGRGAATQLLFGPKLQSVFELTLQATDSYEHSGVEADGGWQQYIVEVLPFFCALLNPCLRSMQYSDFGNENNRLALFSLLLLFGDDNVRRTVHCAENVYLMKRAANGGSVRGGVMSAPTSGSVAATVALAEHKYVCECVALIVDSKRLIGSEPMATLFALDESVKETRQALKQLMIPLLKCMQSEFSALFGISEAQFSQQLADGLLPSSLPKSEVQKAMHSYYCIEELLKREYGLGRDEVMRGVDADYFKTPRKKAVITTRPSVEESKADVSTVKTGHFHARSEACASPYALGSQRRAVQTQTTPFVKGLRHAKVKFARGGVLQSRNWKLQESNAVSNSVWRMPAQQFEVAFVLHFLRFCDCCVLFPLCARLSSVANWADYCERWPFHRRLRALCDARLLAWLSLFAFVFCVAPQIFTKALLPLFILTQILARWPR